MKNEITAKEYLQNKYPSMKENWNATDIDDNWVAEQMEEFAVEKQRNKKLNEVGDSFVEGERVLVKDKHHDSWVEKDFVSKYQGKILVFFGGYFTIWDECKPKPSLIDEKIEELRLLSEKEGIKLTITFK